MTIQLKLNANEVLSGSLNQTGPAELQMITASYALSATTASFLLGSIASASFATTSSFSVTASFALTNAGQVTSAATASLALAGTGSFNGAFTGSYTGTFIGNGAGIVGVLTSSFTLSSSLANLATNAITASFAPSYLPLSGGVVIGSASFNNNVEIDGKLSVINIQGLRVQNVTTTVQTEQSISFTDASSSFFVNFNSDTVQSSPKLQFILSGSTGSFQFVNGNLTLTQGTLFATASLTGSAVLTGTFSGLGSGITGIITASYANTATNLNGLATYSSENIGTFETPALNQIPSTGSTFNTNVVKLFVNPGTGSDAVLVLPTGSLGMNFWIQNVGTGSFRVLINSGNIVGASTNLQAIYPGYYGEATWTSAGVWRTTNSGLTATASLAITASNAITASAATSITFIVPTASFALTSSVALNTLYTASYALNAGISTLATTASYGSGTFFATLSFSSSNATNAINATNAQTASYGSGTFFAQAALSSSYSLSGSFASTAISSSWTLTASFAANTPAANTSSFALATEAAGVGQGAFPSGAFIYTGSLIVSGTYGQVFVNVPSGGFTASQMHGFIAYQNIPTTASGINQVLLPSASVPMRIEIMDISGQARFQQNTNLHFVSVLPQGTDTYLGSVASGYPTTSIINAVVSNPYDRAILTTRGDGAWYCQVIPLATNFNTYFWPGNFGTYGQTELGSADFATGSVLVFSAGKFTASNGATITYPNQSATGSVPYNVLQVQGSVKHQGTLQTWVTNSTAFNMGSGSLLAYVSASGDFILCHSASYIGLCDAGSGQQYNLTFISGVLQSTASNAISSSNATNAINATTAQTASYGSGTFFAQAALSSSFASIAISSSFAQTASFALNAGAGGGTAIATASTAIFTQIPFVSEYGVTLLMNPVPSALTEIDPSLRMKVDLSNAASASTYAHITQSGPSGSWLTIQYSTDEVNWTSFTSLSLMNIGTSMSIYSPIPVTESTQVIVRAVTTNGDGATTAEIGSFGLGLQQISTVAVVTASFASASYCPTASYVKLVTVISGSQAASNLQLTSSIVLNPGFSNAFVLYDPNTASLSVNLPSHSLGQLFNIRNVGVSGALCIADNNNVTQSMAGQPTILYAGMYMNFLDTGLAWIVY